MVSDINMRDNRGESIVPWETPLNKLDHTNIYNVYPIGQRATAPNRLTD